MSWSKIAARAKHIYWQARSHGRNENEALLEALAATCGSIPAPPNI